jgi:hypothetical protein
MSETVILIIRVIAFAACAAFTLAILNWVFKERDADE